jgi:hypothetical protein
MILTLTTGLFLGNSVGRAQTVIYVDDDATEANDGPSRLSAYTHLQDALADAAKSDNGVTEIRVARGVYKPDADSWEDPTTRSSRSGSTPYRTASSCN